MDKKLNKLLKGAFEKMWCTLVFATSISLSTTYLRWATYSLPSIHTSLRKINLQTSTLAIYICLQNGLFIAWTTLSFLLYCYEYTYPSFSVIITGTHGSTFRKLMKLAYEKGYHNGDYIFISINYYVQKKIFGDFNWNQVSEKQNG